jgi:hypothetical protein
MPHNQSKQGVNDFELQRATVSHAHKNQTSHAKKKQSSLNLGLYYQPARY